MIYDVINKEIKSKNFLSALKKCDSYEQIDVDKAVYLKALIYFKLKKYELAQKNIVRVERKDIKTGKYYFLMGNIYEKLKKTELSEKSYFIAVRKQPKNEKYIKKYINYAKSKNMYGNAIRKIKSILDSKSGKDFLLRLELVEYDIYINNLKGAFLELKNLEIRSDCNINKISNLYSRIYEAIGDYENAILKLNQEVVPRVDNIFRKNDFNFMLGRDRDSVVFSLYNFDLVRKNKKLTIVFSPLLNKFILRGYDFNTSVLYISEKIFSYYVYDYENLVSYLVSLIEENNFETINLTGSSKGSFAAINIGLGLEEYLNSDRIKVISFSPQAYIYPINNDISGLPSYKEVLQKYRQSISFKNDLQKYGNPIERMKNSNIKIDIIYGEDHARDKKEAEKYLHFNNVKLKPLVKYPFHTSILLYTKKGESLIRSLTNKTVTSSKDDIFFKPDGSDVLMEQILDKIDDYNFELNELLLD